MPTSTPKPHRYLLPTESAKPVPVPMGLAGFPTEREGHPIEYRSKEICRAGRSVRDVAGNQFDITRERMDRWVENFRKMLANGMTVPLPTKHFDYDSKDNRGFVVAMERKGDSLYATEQLIGADAVLDAARNDQSVFIDFNLPDDRGNVYDEVISHVAMTPCPQVTGLSGFAKVAASRGAVVDAVVLLDSPATATQTERSPEMDPIVKLFREQLGVADSIPDTDLPAVLTAKLAEAKTTGKTEADTAHAVALSRITTERDEAKAQATVAMGRAAPAMPDENTQLLLMESLAVRRDEAIRSGGITAHVATQLEALLCPGGKPSAVALSRNAGEPHPLAFRLFALLSENKPGEAKNGAKTGQQAVALARTTPVSDSPEQRTEAEAKAAEESVLSQSPLGRDILAARRKAS